MPKKLDQTTIDKIVELCNQGFSMHKIAETLNVHKNSVEKYTRENNVHCHSEKTAEEYKDLIIKRLEEGKTSEEIGQELQLSGSAIRRYCTKNGIPLSRKRIRNKRCEQVKKLHDAGKLPIEIETELGLHPETLKICYRDLGITPHKNRLTTISELDPLENIEYISLDGRSCSMTTSEKREYIQKIFNHIASKKQRYVCTEDLVEYGISQYHISAVKFSITKANAQLGLYKTQSVFEDTVIHILREHNVLFETQKTFDSCKSSKNKLLRFDLYIPCINTLIELDGAQHTDEQSL